MKRKLSDVLNELSDMLSWLNGVMRKEGGLVFSVSTWGLAGHASEEF